MSNNKPTGVAFADPLFDSLTVTNATALNGAVTMASTLAITGTMTTTGGVAPAGGLSMSPRLVATGGDAAISTTQGTDTATGATTEVYFGEIAVPSNTSSTGVAWLNGSAVAGNVTAYLYDSTGTFVAKTASTAQASTNAYQQAAWSGGPIALKGPATYYIGWSGDTTGGTQKYRSHILGNFGAAKVTSQVYGTQPATAAGNAPTTFTTNLAPIAGLY